MSEDGTYRAVSAMCGGNNNTTVADVISSVAECFLSTIDHTSKRLPVLGVAEYNSRIYSVLDRCGQLTGSEVCHLCALAKW
jgi:hypothetical protein